jgi:hypothetical protein
MSLRLSTWLPGLLAAVAVLMAPGAHASLDDEIKAAVAADPVLSSGSTGLVMVNSHPYLVAVGAGLLTDGSLKSVLRARRMSKLRAEEGFIRFVRGETVSTETTLQLRGTTQQAGGQSMAARSEALRDIQRAYAQGYLPPTKAIEAWQYDKSTMLHVIYVETPTAGGVDPTTR